VQFDLPDPVAAFIRGVNAADIDALLGAFAEHAMVNDQLREYWDRSAISTWAEREVVGQHLSLSVRSVVRHREHSVVKASIDGTFDKRGLPDPLVVTFYFSVSDGRIVQLVILRNEGDETAL
jgi:hypothetical protein